LVKLIGSSVPFILSVSYATISLLYLHCDPIFSMLVVVSTEFIDLPSSLAEWYTFI